MTVYFITEKGRVDSPVKIGTTADLEKRLSGLQTSHHQELEIIACLDGGRETEAYLHESLAEHRIRGEWFRRTAEVNAVIERAKQVGASSLPLADPGSSAPRFSISQDVELAKSICRAIVGQVLPGGPVKQQVVWLTRKLRRSCPSITESRAKTLISGEARRIDHFEMAALIDLRDRLNRHCDDRIQVITAPTIGQCVAELGTPFSPEQQAIVDRHVQECAARLHADRLEWGFDPSRGASR